MFFLTWLANIGIGTIATKIAAAYEARQTAKTDIEAIAADERIKALQARRDVMIAESGSMINAIIRAMLALPVALYFGKLYLWDKVLGWGVTDPLSPMLQQVAMVIIGFYFLAEGAAQVTRIAKGR